MLAGGEATPDAARAGGGGAKLPRPRRPTATARPTRSRSTHRLVRVCRALGESSATLRPMLEAALKLDGPAKRDLSRTRSWPHPRHRPACRRRAVLVVPAAAAAAAAAAAVATAAATAAAAAAAVPTTPLARTRRDSCAADAQARDVHGRAAQGRLVAGKFGGVQYVDKQIDALDAKGHTVVCKDIMRVIIKRPRRADAAFASKVGPSCRCTRPRPAARWRRKMM